MVDVSSPHDWMFANVLRGTWKHVDDPEAKDTKKDKKEKDKGKDMLWVKGSSLLA